MDLEEFRELQQQVRENNKILKGLQRHARMAMIGSIVKVVIYIAIIVGSYYYIQPYLDKAFTAFEGIQNTSDSIGDLKGKATSEFEDILDRFRAHTGE